jgi:hypothetical protein
MNEGGNRRQISERDNQTQYLRLTFNQFLKCKLMLSLI